MNLTRSTLSFFMAACIMLMSCGGPKDSDIKANIEERLKDHAEMPAPASVSVSDGVVTLSGECLNDTCKRHCEELTKGVKGVKSVVNNMTVAAPVLTPPLETVSDEQLTKGVEDATKDHPAVKATVNGGTITLTGEIRRDKLAGLMQTLNSLKPVKVENNLTIK